MSLSPKICPLLKDPTSYNPDTIDLVNNLSERHYWLPCLENMAKKFISKASYLNPNDPTATEKAEFCFKQFQTLIAKAEKDDSVLSPLSIRTLLEFNEDLLRSNDFQDAWLLQKESESVAAFKDFEERISYIDSIADFEVKWTELVCGALAGNVFDWGSKSVADILEQAENFSLGDALVRIEQRPWFEDHLDAWIKRIKHEQYYQVVVFVDNAGVDFVLGMLPFIRELLLRGSNVILTANSSPALNDVTFKELKYYIRLAGDTCRGLNKALISGQLILVENGQKGPCLDLNNLSPELCRLMVGSDLVILEGMGRAVHTNLYAKFKVDSLKLAVLKNEWLARSLGAKKQFSVIFKFEQV